MLVEHKVVPPNNICTFHHDIFKNNLFTQEKKNTMQIGVPKREGKRRILLIDCKKNKSKD
jgi:hypothetical protein